MTGETVERAILDRAQAAGELASLDGRRAVSRNAAWWLVILELKRQIRERDAFLSHLVWC